MPPALRRELAMKVFQHTARYDSLIAGYLENRLHGERGQISQDPVAAV